MIIVQTRDKNNSTIRFREVEYHNSTPDKYNNWVKCGGLIPIAKFIIKLKNNEAHSNQTKA